MADLVTHLATVLLPAAFAPKRPRALGPLAIGVVLPDLAGAATRILYERIATERVPGLDEIVGGFAVFHQPLGCALLCVLLAQAFCDEDRRTAILGLLAGAALHFGVDVMQDHHGQGYFLLFPFSMRQTELGLVGSESTVRFAPWLAGMVALAWTVRWLVRRRRA